MSYSPATKLSHSNGTQRATVLTGDNVMVTQGLGLGQMMKIADWKILADGAKIEEVVAPVIEDVQANINHAAALWAHAAARWTILKIGDKLRWTLNPTNYRIAIMTSKGVLQVKAMDEINGVSLKKTMFEHESAWRDSLPDGGSVDVLEPSKAVEEQKAINAYKGLTDIEKVNALVKRYKIRDGVIVLLSIQERMTEAAALVDRLRISLNRLTLQDHLNGDGLDLCKRLKCAAEHYTRCKRLFDGAVLRGRDVNKHDLRDNRKGTGHILATIAGVECIIVPFNNKIAAISLSERWSNAKTYTSFAEMGNPALSVRYRGRTINV